MTRSTGRPVSRAEGIVVQPVRNQGHPATDSPWDLPTASATTSTSCLESGVALRFVQNAVDRAGRSPEDAAMVTFTSSTIVATRATSGRTALAVKSALATDASALRVAQGGIAVPTVVAEAAGLAPPVSFAVPAVVSPIVRRRVLAASAGRMAAAEIAEHALGARHAIPAFACRAQILAHRATRVRHARQEAVVVGASRPALA